MDSRRLNFATTLEAVDAPSVSTGANSCFPKFSSLPPELRLPIWQHVLPDAEAEQPALFSQRHSYAWTDSDGLLKEPDGQIPIRMTTTCAALLHVNQESRRTVLLWAARQEYELCYRMFCREMEDFCDSDDESDSSHGKDKEHEKRLPVQGPIFVRRWNACKDILHVLPFSDYNGIPSHWAEQYVNGEQLSNVQHLAFSIDDIDELLMSRWFLQLLAATPDLRSVSFNDGSYQDNGETFFLRFIEIRDVRDPWITAGCNLKDEADIGRRRFSSPFVRWETATCEPIAAKSFQQTRFKERLIKAYMEEDLWPPEQDCMENTSDVLRGLPPWVRNLDKDTLALEVWAFSMVERRGYDDIRDGLVADCGELYPGW